LQKLKLNKSNIKSNVELYQYVSKYMLKYTMVLKKVLASGFSLTMNDIQCHLVQLFMVLSLFVTKSSNVYFV